MITNLYDRAKLPLYQECHTITSPLWTRCEGSELCREKGITEHQVKFIDTDRHLNAYRCVFCGAVVEVSTNGRNGKGAE